MGNSLQPCLRILGIRQQVPASQGVAVAAVVSVNGRPVVSTTWARSYKHRTVVRLQYDEGTGSGQPSTTRIYNTEA